MGSKAQLSTNIWRDSVRRNRIICAIEQLLINAIQMLFLLVRRVPHNSVWSDIRVDVEESLKDEFDLANSSTGCLFELLWSGPLLGRVDGHFVCPTSWCQAGRARWLRLVKEFRDKAVNGSRSINGEIDRKQVDRWKAFQCQRRIALPIRRFTSIRIVRFSLIAFRITAKIPIWMTSQRTTISSLAFSTHKNTPKYSRE